MAELLRRSKAGGGGLPSHETERSGRISHLDVDLSPNCKDEMVSGVAMADRRSIEELKELGAGRPAPSSVVALYHRAFAEFGIQALWSRKPTETVTIAQALVIAENLRREGNMQSRPLAAEIEDACRAAL